MLDVLLETLGTLGVLASIVAKLAAYWPEARERRQAGRQEVK